jgi:hypothetical protein
MNAPGSPAPKNPPEVPALADRRGRQDRRTIGMTDEKKHVGDFAEGQSDEHVEQGELMGDFAAGQEDKPRLGTVQPRGDFAEGQEEEKPDPTAPRGNFAEGQEASKE